VSIRDEEQNERIVVGKYDGIWPLGWSLKGAGLGGESELKKRKKMVVVVVEDIQDEVRRCVVVLWKLETVPYGWEQEKETRL